MMVSIPSLSAINEALSLLAVMRNPGVIEEMLAELADQKTEADGILEKARAAEADATSKLGHIDGAIRTLDANRVKLHADQDTFMAFKSAQEALLARMQDEAYKNKDAMDNRKAMLEKWAADLLKEEAELNKRGLVAAGKEHDLDEREKSLNELASIIRPIADKLGVSL